MNYWLMKSEEDEYSIDDLKRDKKSSWFGVRNYQARNFMRDSMKIGDLAFFYHSNGDPSAIVGVCRIVSLPHPDTTQFDTMSPYFEKRATKEKPIWTAVDVEFVKKYTKPLSINEMRTRSTLSTMILLRKGSRLSITPVTKHEFDHIDSLCSD
jgi:predicted RNA-binding protein with PUA-like domain